MNAVIFISNFKLESLEQNIIGISGNSKSGEYFQCRVNNGKIYNNTLTRIPCVSAQLIDHDKKGYKNE